MSDESVRVKSDDDNSELGMNIKPEMKFIYGEPRDFPEEAKRFERGVAVVFSEGVTPSDATSGSLQDIVRHL